MKLSTLHLSSAIPLALSMLALPLIAKDGDGAAKGKPKRAERAQQDADDDDAGGERERGEGKGLEIGKLLPLNKPNLQVKIPGFDKGELASMVEAEKLTRIDQVNLRLEDATIELVQQELLIRLREALYNTEDAILSSNQTTTVSSKQFTMTGDTMDFDTKTGKGRMTARADGTGMVRMIIHNIDAMGDKKKPLEPAAVGDAELPAATQPITIQPEPEPKK